MTAIAIKDEQAVLLTALAELIAKCKNVNFADILRAAESDIKAGTATTENVTRRYVRRRPRISDAELEEALASEPSFDIQKYTEPTKEQWQLIAASNRGRLNSGLEKWL